MARIRDRRVQKDDVLIPLDILPAVRMMDDAAAHQFFIDLLEMGQDAAIAGYKKDTDELQDAIGCVVQSKLESMTERCKDPFMAYMMANVARGIEQKAIAFYTKSNTQSSNRAAAATHANGSMTAEQREQAQRVAEWLTSTYKRPTEQQESIINYFAGKGGTVSELSMQLIYKDKSVFDPYQYMKNR